MGPQRPGDSEGPDEQNDLPPEILDIIWPALQVGGASGISGMTIGAFAGVIRSTTPHLYALASGIQWFTLGTTFWASRAFVLQKWGNDKVSPKEKVSASAIAGSIAGTAGGLLRSRQNVLPGALMFAIFGATGQVLYNRADAQQTSKALNASPTSPRDSWLNSRWSPMKLLSDKEYEAMLQEKLLKVNAEIALVDESIESLRMQERDLEAKKAKEVENLKIGKTV